MDSTIVKNSVRVALSNLMIVFSGIVSGLVLPKILGVTDYGCYKIFNLYTTYVVFLDFGITNGIFLKYGGYKREELPAETFRLYFRSLLIIQCLFSVITIVMSIILLTGEYKFIFLMLAAYTVVSNISNYYEKISIMTGEFSSTIKRNITKSFLSVLIVTLLWASIKIQLPLRPYKIYTILFVLVYAVLAIQYIKIYANVTFGKAKSFEDHIDEFRVIVQSGIILLLADTVSNLILNLDRQFVSMLFSVEEYSLYAFAYSMLKIVVLAISAISTVLYPSLKRMPIEKLRSTYSYTTGVVSVISFACLMGYYPLCIFVEWFLQPYIGSLAIFRVLFPGISISMIIAIVMINHFKALGKQNDYFVISIIVLLVAALTNIISYIISKRPIGFSVASLITIIIWYLISDLYLQKTYYSKEVLNYIYMICNIVVYFLITSNIQSYYYGFIINMALFMAISTLVYYNETAVLSRSIINRIKTRR